MVSNELYKKHKVSIPRRRNKRVSKEKFEKQLSKEYLKLVFMAEIQDEFLIN